MINLEICDTSNIKDAFVKIEKSKVVLQGINYCKTYELPKGITMNFQDNSLKVEFDFDFLKNKIQNQGRNTKFASIIREMLDHNKIKHNKNLWNDLINNSNEIDIEKLDNINAQEKNIKYKSHALYSHFITMLDGENCLFENDKKIYLSKKTDYEEYFKSNGGIIFDYNNNFITKFNNSLKNVKNSENKNILMSDILPKQESNLNFSYKHIKHVKRNLELTQKRLIIYYPTKEMICQLVKLIQDGLTKPRIIWLVFPANSRDFLNFNEVLNILFWSKKTLFIINPSIVSLKCGKNKLEPKRKNQIILEKVKYKLNTIEKNLLGDANSENLSILDKLYFYNLSESLPKTIYRCDDCPICCMNFDENKDSISYMPCGHMFCSECVMKTIKVKNCCPSCRKNSKFNGIVIPKLISTKMELLLKIINKQKIKDKLTLIYVDNFTLAKKLMIHLNKLENDNGNNNICNIINQKSSLSERLNEKILICPIENDYLCQSVKNINNVIVLIMSSDYSLKPESLGYDYYHDNSDVKIWLFECVY